MESLKTLSRLSADTALAVVEVHLDAAECSSNPKALSCENALSYYATAKASKQQMDTNSREYHLHAEQSWNSSVNALTSLQAE